MTCCVALRVTGGPVSQPCAVSQVPGLFEGDEYATLMTQCKEGAQKEGLMLDSHEELYKWFTSQVIRNLHVVFTMNPSSEGLKDRAATSPALFNRYADLYLALGQESRCPSKGQSLPFIAVLKRGPLSQVCVELVWRLVHRSTVSGWQRIHK